MYALLADRVMHIPAQMSLAKLLKRLGMPRIHERHGIQVAHIKGVCSAKATRTQASVPSQVALGKGRPTRQRVSQGI